MNVGCYSISRSQPMIRFCLACRSASKPAYLPHLESTSASNAQRFVINLGSIRSSSTTQTLPHIGQPSFWRSLFPSSLRSPQDGLKRARASKGWNPATFYIVIFLLIGSQGIHMIALKNEYLNFCRKADAKIALLKEVMERVQRGEDVDVEGLLGTGNHEKEKEWEEVLREIEQQDVLWQSSSQKRKAKKRLAAQDAEPDPNNSSTNRGESQSGSTTAEAVPANRGPPEYY